MSDVYLILNETTFHGTDQVTTEVLEATLSYQKALDYIAEIALENDIVLTDDASVTLAGAYGTGIEADEYYVIEMELK